ncbi:MAG: homoserine dehydrogenase, partial [Coriobacteriaceae bacterium]|nr:homoserine dehydrogenase [Coriobacteriaceae bacterium]
LATSAAVFAQNGVSIFSVVQRGAHDQTAELAYVTHSAREEAVRASLKGIAETGILTGEPVLIRVEDSQA